MSWRDWVYLRNRQIVVQLCWDDVFPSLGFHGLELISVIRSTLEVSLDVALEPSGPQSA